MASVKGGSIMGRFFGKPELESYPNAAKKGIKLYTRAEINGVKGYESLYRLFWNRKAEELCGKSGFQKWSKGAIGGVIATEWTLKKTALLSSHAQRLMRQQSASNTSKRKQKADTVHQGTISMLGAHNSLLRLDEKLRSLKISSNTARDKKKKIQALEDDMQAALTEVKKRQEALRKGLETMAKEKEVNNVEMVGGMSKEVNTTQLEQSSIQALIDSIVPENERADFFEEDNDVENDVRKMESEHGESSSDTSRSDTDDENAGQSPRAKRTKLDEKDDFSDNAERADLPEEEDNDENDVRKMESEHEDSSDASSGDTDDENAGQSPRAKRIKLDDGDDFSDNAERADLSEEDDDVKNDVRKMEREHEDSSNASSGDTDDENAGSPRAKRT